MADIKGKLKNDLKNMPYIRQFLHEYFDLGKDKDNEAVTVESIRNGVEFKGTNLWILIFAIFIYLLFSMLLRCLYLRGKYQFF